MEWPEQAKVTRTIERERAIVGLLEDRDVDADGFAEAFLRAPLFSTAYAHGFGTLYTAVYRPVLGRAEIRWPAHAMPLGFEGFSPQEHTEVLAEPAFTEAGEAPG